MYCEQERNTHEGGAFFMKYIAQYIVVVNGHEIKIESITN